MALLCALGPLALNDQLHTVETLFRLPRFRAEETKNTAPVAIVESAPSKVKQASMESEAIQRKVIPSEEEKMHYYDGLPSKPQLVARSNADTKWRRRVMDQHLVLKHIANVGRHAIVDAMNNTSLPNDIMNFLDHRAPGWNCIDVLRIGIQDEEMPVILWVGVHPGSTTAKIGIELAHECYGILQTHGISDVHCEIRETYVKLATSCQPPVPTIDPSEIAIRGWHFPGFTETIGQSVALEAAPTREATLTCYVSLSAERDGTSERHALISRHLAFPDNDDKAYRYTRSSPSHYIIMPGDTTLKETLQKVENALKIWKTHMSGIQDQPAKLAVAKAEFQKTKKFHGHLISLTTPESRRIGHVVYSPARVPEAQTQGFAATTNSNYPDWVPDYAIVKLDTARFKSRLNDLKNEVYLDTLHSSHALLNQSFLTNPYELPDNNASLLLQGFIPAAELHKPTSHSGRLDYVANEFILRVGKRGRSSGLTWGQGNEIRSFTRQEVNGRDVKSLHWPVLSINGRNSFSVPGDSGSALFTADGRLAAMLDAGCSNGIDKLDVTYSTPLEWILEHIKKNALKSAYFP